MNHSANVNRIVTVLCGSRGSSTPGRHDVNWTEKVTETVHEMIPFTPFTQKIRSFERHVRDRHNTSFRSFSVDPCGYYKTTRIIYMYKFYSPILCNFISGLQTTSSSLRWRSISSSYSTIIFWKTPNISSAAAVSRSLMKPLKHSTEDIFNE